MAAKTMLGATERVVLVDDVITRGATIAAAATRLLEAFPNMSIRAFAVAHTESEMPNIVAPRMGTIHTHVAGEWSNRINDGSFMGLDL